MQPMFNRRHALVALSALCAAMASPVRAQAPEAPPAGLTVQVNVVNPEDLLDTN